MSQFILFNISDKDKPHIMFFYNFTIPIPFSALNSSTHFNIPKLRLAAKKYTLFAKDVDAAVCLKKLPFSTLFVHGGA